MKKSSLVKASIIAMGSIISLGGAFALYQNNTSLSTNINISTSTLVNVDTTITYEVAKNSDGKVTPVYLSSTNQKGSALDNAHTRVKYNFELGASYSAHAQGYVVGNAKVTISNIDAYTKAHATFWAAIDGFTAANGYTNGENGTEYTVGSEVSFSKPFMTTNVKLSTIGEDKTSYSVNSDIVVETSGKQSIVVYVEYDEIDLTEVNSTAAPFSLSVEWGAPTEAYEFAYILGDGNQWAMNQGDYSVCPRMVPNLKASAFEWAYKGLSGSIGEFKFKYGDVWTKDPNFKYEETDVLDCYWKVSADGKTNNPAIVKQGA